MGQKTIIAKVFRLNPQEDNSARYDVYRVFCDRSISVLNLLYYIHHSLDPSLAFRNYFCHLGVCLSCLLRINGRNLRGCTKMFNPGDHVTIEPPSGYRVVRDLVVDFGAKGRSFENV